jgi:hypothetical protein
MADATDLKSFAAVQNTPENQANPNSGDGCLRNACANRASADAELAAVVDAWPDLPADVKKMIGGVIAATIAAKRAGKRRR